MTGWTATNADIAVLEPLAVGDTIGPYRILRQLGQGTTSRVFEVEHVRIGRRAALKIVHREGVAPGIVDRLFAEAHAVNLINHPHVVEITDILVPDANQPDHALVMELLEGRSLADVIAAEGPLPPARFLPILAEICAGLAAVHPAGFVHRDLKPENMFLVERGGQPRLRQAARLRPGQGAAAATSASARRRSRGRSWDRRRTPSPEQAAGQARRLPQPTSTRSASCSTSSSRDSCRFEAEHIADLLMKQINAAPPRLSAELLADRSRLALDAIIQACLVKDPGRARADRGAAGGDVSPPRRRRPRGAARPSPRAAPPSRAAGGAARSRSLPLVALGVLAVVAPGSATSKPAPPAPRRRWPRRRWPARAAVRRRRRPRTGGRRRRPRASRRPSRGRRRARDAGRGTPPRLSKAMTLDPYR